MKVFFSVWWNKSDSDPNNTAVIFSEKLPEEYFDTVHINYICLASVYDTSYYIGIACEDTHLLDSATDFITKVHSKLCDAAIDWYENSKMLDHMLREIMADNMQLKICWSPRPSGEFDSLFAIDTDIQSFERSKLAYMLQED